MLKGQTVMTAFGGTEALPLIEQHEIDLINSDVTVPEVDGPAFYDIWAIDGPTTKNVSCF